MVELLEKAQAILDAEYSSAFFDGKDEGKAEGKAEGIAEERLLIAKAMLLDGDSLDKVARNTGLSLEQVYNLQS